MTQSLPQQVYLRYRLGTRVMAMGPMLQVLLLPMTRKWDLKVLLLV